MKLKTGVISKTFDNKLTRPFYLLFALIVLSSHDLYIKMETYFLKPNQEASFSLYNGTFESSENTISRDRLLDASIVAHGKRVAISARQWVDQDSTVTKAIFKPTEEGTYVAGVSTKERVFQQTAEEFNSYLKHDGVLDMLNERKYSNTLDEDVAESYQKHVKAIYQVGDQKSEDWKTILGYPIEFVPMDNPYAKHSGESLDVQLLLDGQPLANQIVYADHVSGHHSHDGHTHSHDHGSDHEHTHTNGKQLRTNDQGIITVGLPEDGIYFLRTIHMKKVEGNKDYTHQSKWSTLTFEVTHEHGEHTHTHDHDHDHDHEEGIPTSLFVIVSLFIIATLFMYFRKNN
ncbi:DUF4198 domain-containing protein [Flammeovirga agarivorans]|uniref:DUF4198 domain-containing protein n=1 Tax=Flammeovirga agarivorans TaxID=2726742 RepID=A0A7X8SJJ8_9BACT|nr:DUF4198 domain-containing protein [Flammeovirga agarivorans]NLR91434.1 DUF4198 domain-containing protein [Flammeovirga agarivorans]